jgi:hypothetical protein
VQEDWYTMFERHKAMKLRFQLGIILNLALGVLALPRPATGDMIVIGGTKSNNAFPFGTTDYHGEYQQLYAISAFSGPATITEIAFASAMGFGSGQTRNLNFSLGLSSSPASLAAPSTNYGANKGPDFTTGFSGSLSFAAQGTNTFDLVIPITPFAYTPDNGNLLLDVVINSSGKDVFFVFGRSPDTSRVYNSAGSGAATVDPGEGLETQFTVSAAQTVPEPATLTLAAMAMTLLGGVGWMWQRKATVA